MTAAARATEPDALIHARAAHAAGAMTDAELACVYVLAHVESKVGSRARQGRRKPPIACASPSPHARIFADERVHGIEEPVARALCAMAAGERPVAVLFHVPTTLDVLRLQANGCRCVSLLPPDVDPKPHADGLAFARHDLCHLEKFVDPEHHHGQVGFSRVVLAAIDRGSSMLTGWDETFRDERDHVLADMNGSAIFLFAALKMKLKMAVRRAVAREAGVPPRVSGALDPDEWAAYERALGVMLDELELPPEIRAAAIRVSTRRDDLDAALTLLGWFEERGR